MSKTVNGYGKLGLGGALTVGIFILFVFLNHTSSDFWSTHQITWNAIEKTLTNDNSTSGYSQETMVLITIWILLMIVGSYLLVHIHFRVLREEKR